MAISSVVSPNVQISNATAQPSALDSLNADSPQSPNGSGTSVLKDKPRNTVLGQGGVNAMQQPNGTLVAAGLARTPSPIQRINNWNKAIVPAVNGYKPGAVPIRTPVPGAATVKPGPRIEVPSTPNSPAPTSTFFGPGSPVVSAPGVPALKGQPTTSMLAIVNAALPQTTVDAFASLTQKQKLIARTMLGAAIEGLRANPSSPDYIAPKDFKPLVGLILKNAQAYREPAAIVPSPAGKPATVPPAATTKPVVVPALPIDPAIVATLPKDPKAAIEASKTPKAPIETAPPAKPTTPSVTPPEIAGLTLTPEIYNALIVGADGKPDPVRKANTDNLLAQAQEFRAQIETIIVDEAVNPAVSTKTPLQEWNDWKSL
jgi:hypothetical protein